MKKRPLLVKFLALCFLLSPLGILIELAIMAELPLPYLWLVFTPPFWHPQVLIVTLLTPVVGYGIWSTKCWGFWAVLAYSLGMFVNNIVLFVLGITFDNILITIAFNTIMIAIVLVFLMPVVRAPYFNPRLRWWEQATRWKTHDLRVLVKEFGTGRLLFEAEAFDISETGVFIATDRIHALHDIFHLEIHGAHDLVLHAGAEIVWAPKHQATRPHGYGCKFTTVDREFRKRIHSCIQEIKKLVKTRADIQLSR